MVLTAAPSEEVRAEIDDLVSGLGQPVTSVPTGQEALIAVETSRPDLVLLAADLTDPCGFEVLHRLRLNYGPSPAVAVLAATEAPSPRDEVAALLLGADDYLGRPIRVDGALARLRRLVDHAPSTRRERLRGPSELTRREGEVLALLAGGERTDAIAQRLCITRKTTSTHIERILRKLGVHTQAQAVSLAVREHLVSLPRR